MSVLCCHIPDFLLRLHLRRFPRTQTCRWRCWAVMIDFVLCRPLPRRVG